MSSFSPYQVPIHPPTGDWLGPIDELLAPARRASTLMLVLGALALVGGICIGGAAFMPLDEMIRRSNFDLTQFQGSGLTPEQFLRTLFGLTAALAVGVAVAMLILGWLIRRGGAVPAIISIVLIGLLTLLIGVQAVAQLVQASLAPNDYMIGSAIFSLLIAAMLVLLITWLAGAIRGAGDLRRARERQTEQWYAMQHHPAWNGAGATYGPNLMGGSHDAAASPA